MSNISAVSLPSADTWFSAAIPVGNPAPEGGHPHDIMSYGDKKWMSPRTYINLYENLGKCHGFPREPDRTQAQAQAAAYWLVAGLFQPALTVRPIFRVTADSALVPAGDSGRYLLELQDGVGTVLFSRSLSAHAPTVSVSQPAAGTTWPAAGLGAIRWLADDADGDSLTYVVMYSRDGGQTWVNLATGLTEPRYDIELDTLGGSDGQAQISVLANDGLRTGQGDSGLFTVERKGPDVYIVHPEANVVISPEQPLLLMGYGSDREDGPLPADSLQWTDNVGGPLGSGEEKLLYSLAQGTHTITLQASDSDGNPTLASVTVHVGYQLHLHLPLVLK